MQFSCIMRTNYVQIYKLSIFHGSTLVKTHFWSLPNKFHGSTLVKTGPKRYFKIKFRGTLMCNCCFISFRFHCTCFLFLRRAFIDKKRSFLQHFFAKSAFLAVKSLHLCFSIFKNRRFKCSFIPKTLEILSETHNRIYLMNSFQKSFLININDS